MEKILSFLASVAIILEGSTLRQDCRISGRAKHKLSAEEKQRLLKESNRQTKVSIKYARETKYKSKLAN
jgi:hypothetical protein